VPPELEELRAAQAKLTAELARIDHRVKSVPTTTSLIFAVMVFGFAAYYLLKTGLLITILYH